MSAGSGGPGAFRGPRTADFPAGWRLVLACAAIFAIGAWLRLDQFAQQVLLDDEWHAVHQVLAHGPAQFLVDLGHADYGIPLALYDWALVHSFGLSETAMRMPMMLAGLATLALLPLAVASRIGREAALGFALLVALSPPLIAYSQVARPYAFDVLLGWYAHWAFRRWWDGSGRHGAGYAAAASLACWMHLVAAPFVLAPFAWAAWRLLRDPALRRAQLARTLRLCGATALTLAVLLGPPIALRPSALGAKGGFEEPGAATLGGALYWWFGTRSTIALLLALTLAAIGLPRVWRALPEARTGVLGLACTVGAVALTRPEWSQAPLVFGRYLLPLVPLALCATACGAVTAGYALAGRGRHRALGAFLLTLVVAGALVASSPLREWTRHPSSYRLGIQSLYDFRTESSATRRAVAQIPMSPFWKSLADHPADSLLVAAAPFRFESYDWDAPRWERKSHQRVIPGWLTGLCVAHRPGELPARAGYAFSNAVRLADRAALSARGVDYVVWQKPWVALAEDRLERGGDHVAACESALRAAFGPPVYEDAQLIAFRLARAESKSPR